MFRTKIFTAISFAFGTTVMIHVGFISYSKVIFERSFRIISASTN